MARKEEAPVEKSVPTPEEKAARRAELAQSRLNKDRAKMLDNVQTCLRQASLAIVAGDTTKHNEWLNAARSALDAYDNFARLTAPAAPAAAQVSDLFNS